MLNKFFEFFDIFVFLTPSKKLFLIRINSFFNFFKFFSKFRDLFEYLIRIQNNQLMTSGGRVFCATGTGADLATAQKNAYNLVSKISFDCAVNRKDIGNKGIS